MVCSQYDLRITTHEDITLLYNQLIIPILFLDTNLEIYIVQIVQ